VIAGPCFYPLCTNTTNWFYNGLITIGVEKASQWTNNFGSLDMQMMPLAHDRCIPVAYTSVFVCSPTSIYPPPNHPYKAELMCSPHRERWRASCSISSLGGT
jgi:hypothetical protein